MEKFVPHKIDSEDSFESHLLGDVKAGFPSPAEDIREKLDLIKLLVKHKASTFFFRVSGVSMVDAALNQSKMSRDVYRDILDKYSWDSVARDHISLFMSRQ